MYKLSILTRSIACVLCCRETLPFRGRARLGRGGRVIYDRCTAAVSGMHGAFSESGGVYGANRGDGVDEFGWDRPADRASAIWKHMRVTDSSQSNGTDTRRCDWNYLGGLGDDGPGAGGGMARSDGGVHRGRAEAGGVDWRKRSLSQISRLCGVANGQNINGGAGSSTSHGPKMTNTTDSSMRYESASSVKRSQLDEPEMALSEASTRLDA